MEAASSEVKEGRRERKKRETRAALLSAARRLFEQRGVEGTTIEEITEAADVARATFFNYFPAKSALLGALAADMDRQFADRIEAQRMGDGSTRERLREVFETLSELQHHNPALARQVVTEVRFRGMSSGERRTQVAQMNAALTGLVDDGVARGDVRGDHDVAVLVDLIAGTYFGLLLGWLTDPNYPLGERLPAAVDLVAETLEPRAARRRTSRKLHRASGA